MVLYLMLNFNFKVAITLSLSDYINPLECLFLKRLYKSFIYEEKKNSLKESLA